MWISFSLCVHIKKTSKIYLNHASDLSRPTVLFNFIHIFASVERGRIAFCFYFCSLYLLFNLAIKFNVIVPQNKLSHFNKVCGGYIFRLFLLSKTFLRTLSQYCGKVKPYHLWCNKNGITGNRLDFLSFSYKVSITLSSVCDSLVCINGLRWKPENSETLSDGVPQVITTGLTGTSK